MKTIAIGKFLLIAFSFCIIWVQCTSNNGSDRRDSFEEQRNYKIAIDCLEEIELLYENDEEEFLKQMGDLYSEMLLLDNNRALFAYLGSYYRYLFQRGKHKELLSFLDQFLELHTQDLNQNQLAKIWSYKSSVHIVLYQNLEAKNLLNHAIELNTDPEFEISLQYQLGSISLLEGDYFTAIETFLGCLHSLKDPSNIQLHTSLLTDLSNAYTALERYDKALEFSLGALSVAEQSADLLTIANMHGNLGTKYEKAKEDSLAIEHYNKSMELFSSIQNDYQLARISLNLANLFMKFEQYVQADSLFNLSTTLCETLNIEYGFMLNCLNRGHNYRFLKKYDESKASLLKALKILEPLDLLAEKKHLYENLSLLYEEINVPDSAFHYLNKAFEIEKILFDLEKTSLTENTIAQYENERKEILLAINKEILDTERKKKIYLGSGLFLFSLFAFVSVFVFQWKEKQLGILFKKNIEYLQLEDEIHPFYANIFDALEKKLSSSQLYADPNLTLSTLSDILNTNPNYLSLAIKLKTQSNFNTFINNHRVKAATKLLEQRKDTVTLEEVMKNCGFSNKSTFFTAFKKFTGLTPGQYRKKAP